jgi:hypothetical protein
LHEGHSRPAHDDTERLKHGLTTYTSDGPPHLEYREFIITKYQPTERKLMGGISEKDSWLLDSVAQKILREGDNHVSFALRLRDLETEDQGRFWRLFGICARLEFVEQLRHTARLAVCEQGIHTAQYQLEMLTTYLTTTCMDIATGGEYEHYWQWLKKAVESRSIDNWSSAISALTAAESSSDIAELFIEWTERIYKKDYLDKMGIRRAFKRFVSDMPNWLKKWLAEAYFLVDGDFLSMSQDFKWLRMNDEEKCEQIALYLYDVRNLYTHSVVPRPSMDHEERGRFPWTIGGVRYGFVAFHKGGDIDAKVERSVGLRHAVAESDVVRFLVVAWIRKQWLHIEDDESFVDRYWDRVDYRRVGYRFLHELKANLSLVEAWCSNHLYSPSLERCGPPLAELSDTVAREFVPELKAANHSTSGLLSNVRSYLSSVEQINRKITDFNTQYGGLEWREKAREMDRFFAEIVNLPEVKQTREPGDLHLELSEVKRLVGYIQRIRGELFSILDAPWY